MNFKRYLPLLFTFLLVGSTPQSHGMSFATSAWQTTRGVAESLTMTTASALWNLGQQYPKTMATLALYSAWVGYNKYNKFTERWDWDKIATLNTNPDFMLPHNFKFNNTFLWGVSTSAHQVEGNCDNTFTDFENNSGNPIIKEKSGIACDHWNRFTEDINLIRSLRNDGSPMAYRFSIERSKVEIAPNKFDNNALKHYADVCRELIAQKITPVIVFHHYTDPKWCFEKGRRGFLDEQSITEFGEYAQTVVHYLNHNVFNNSSIKPLWITFNSPDGYAARGYLTAVQPPAVNDRPLMLKVFHNVLRAHVNAYKKIKKIDPTAQVGITKNIHLVKAWSSWNPLEYLPSIANRNLMDKAYYEFFTKGTFTVYFPNWYSSTLVVSDAPQSVDFFGVNYYSHRYMKTLKTPTRDDRDCETENENYVVYPEGLYFAIKDMHENLIKPLNKQRSTDKQLVLYVTENGTAQPNDTDGNAKRTQFYQRYMYAMAKSINDGYPVKGYFTWSLLDNYEWGTYDKHYGIFHVDRTKNLERSLKTGSHYWINLINNNPLYCANTFSNTGK